MNCESIVFRNFPYVWYYWESWVVVTRFEIRIRCFLIYMGERFSVQKSICFYIGIDCSELCDIIELVIWITVIMLWNGCFELLEYSAHLLYWLVDISTSVIIDSWNISFWDIVCVWLVFNVFSKIYEFFVCKYYLLWLGTEVLVHVVCLSIDIFKTVLALFLWFDGYDLLSNDIVDFDTGVYIVTYLLGIFNGNSSTMEFLLVVL